VFLEFGASVGQAVNPANTNLVRMVEAMKARASSAA
jgi:hypothetical protein